MKRFPSIVRFAALALAVVVAPGRVSAVPPPDSAPDELEDVGVNEVPDVQIPLDLPFVDTEGREVTLADCFDGERPVILTLNYSDCPMLCSLQLNGLFEALGETKWNLGEQFQMVTVSIDPNEKPPRAKATKEKYLKVYGRPGAAAGWHFLTGEEQNIKNLANTVGFGYRFVPERKEYVHTAVFMVCTPDGRVSRYLYGVKFVPDTVRLALLEAGEGKVGGFSEKILLYCFQYDPESGSYVPAVWVVMRAAGVVILVGLAGLVGGLVLVRRARSTKQDISEPESAPPDEVGPRDGGGGP